jgi:hypothetical protein
MLKIVKVRTADAHAAIAQQHHARFDLRALKRLNADVSGAVQHGGFHGLGHRYSRILWTYATSLSKDPAERFGTSQSSDMKRCGSLQAGCY